MDFKPGEKQGVVSNPSHYQPSVWGDYFITHLTLPSRHQFPEDKIEQRRNELIEKVKMILQSTTDPLQEMNLIDALQHLGVAYHFEREIDDVLNWISNVSLDSNDFYSVALQFCLLRQHHYPVSSDVFNQFKDNEGNFKAILANDIKGLLSLYEASYLGIPGENVLDEAMDFTRRNLESVASRCEAPLRKKVMHALQTPLHRRMSRLEARNYISMYQEDEESQNSVVLDLATLDFHLLQLLHREEIRALSNWHKDLGISKLPFIRDRIAGCYFWILGVYFEPQYSHARMLMTKLIQSFSIVDDAYDAYGTMEGLDQLTDVIQRWDLEAANQLEECLRLPFFAVDSTLKEFEQKLASEGKSDYVNYLKEKIKEVCRGMIQENRWRDEGYVPSFKQHLQITQITTFYMALACASFLGMGELATQEALGWVSSFPKMIDALTLICRLMDDVLDYEPESKNVATSVHCYMKEHKTSVQEAKEKLLEMIEDAWKVMNQEFLHLIDIPMALHTRVLNLARMMETLYRNSDRYGEPAALKDHIALLLDQPIGF